VRKKKKHRRVAVAIHRIIASKRFSEAAAARRLRINLPKISAYAKEPAVRSSGHVRFQDSDGVHHPASAFGSGVGITLESTGLAKPETHRTRTAKTGDAGPPAIGEASATKGAARSEANAKDSIPC
jgi:hypothetical protein